MTRPSRVALLVIALVGVTGLVAGSVYAVPGPSCFGKQATIVASGPVTVGTSGDDVIVGSAGDDVVLAGDGNDRVCGLDGNDFLRGELGNDRVDGGAGDDVIIGDLFVTAAINVTADGGDDLLMGGPGVDRITGDFRAGLVHRACLPVVQRAGAGDEGGREVPPPVLAAEEQRAEAEGRG